MVSDAPIHLGDIVDHQLCARHSARSWGWWTRGQAPILVSLYSSWETDNEEANTQTKWTQTVIRAKRDPNLC